VVVTTPKKRPSAGQWLRAWFTDASLRQWLRRGAIGVLGTGVLVMLFLLWAYSSVNLPKEPPQLETTIIYDAKGGQLAELYKDENRIHVPLDRVADVFERAVIATEDRKFYEHRGIDPVGTARAFLNDVRGGQVQGGSTITQQLVKNTYLTSERSLSRKFREAILAVKVEREFDKRTILDRYVNTIYFGRGAHGIEKAAELYFGVEASQLNLEQAALLAGLIRAPESADPIKNPEGAKVRRAIVLDAMVRSKAITKKQAAEAKAKPLEAIERPDPNASLRGSSAYFAAMVQNWTTQEFGQDLALTGGLRVETTLDPDLQKAAEDAVKSILDRPDDPDAALVSMTDDGAIVAMIGGKDFQASSVNLAIYHPDVIRPQAGSTFKPIVLAAALEQGIPITKRYPGPAKREIDFGRDGKFEYVNYENSAFGELNLTDATVRSVNTIYGQLSADTGIRETAEMAKELGIEAEVPLVRSQGLGVANISPTEMLRAYMTFANRGRRPKPYFVKRVTDADGNELYEAKVRREPVYPQKYADVVNNVLEQVIQRGTGTAAKIGRDAAGKTGTTDDYTDAWFVGYTPRLGTAVWMGYEKNTEQKMLNVHGIRVSGGTLPTRIWQRFMSVAVKDRDTGDFVAPDPKLMNATTSTSTPDTTTTSTPESTTTSSTSSTSTSTSSTTSTTRPGGGPTTTSSTTSTTVKP
jgi:membrane peptidoglycan carboxypeptidase